MTRATRPFFIGSICGKLGTIDARLKPCPSARRHSRTPPVCALAHRTRPPRHVAGCHEGGRRHDRPGAARLLRHDYGNGRGHGDGRLRRRLRSQRSPPHRPPRAASDVLKSSLANGCCCAVAAATPASGCRQLPVIIEEAGEQPPPNGGDLGRAAARARTALMQSLMRPLAAYVTDGVCNGHARLASRCWRRVHSDVLPGGCPSERLRGGRGEAWVRCAPCFHCGTTRCFRRVAGWKQD